MKHNRSEVPPSLLLNHLKTAFLRFRRQRGYTLINISGLAVGLACCSIMLLWVSNEKSFDSFHKNHDSIYRLIKETHPNGKEILDARIPYPLAENIIGKIPGVKNFTRYQGVDGWKIKFGEKFFYNDFLSTADSTFFEIFSFPFVKGDPKTALADRYSIVISESMARKYFGDTEPMGKVMNIVDESNSFTVTGVFKDVPKNSHLHFDCIIPIVNFWEWWDGRESGWNMIMFYTYLQLQPNSSSVEVGRKISSVLNENVPGQDSGIRMQPLADVHLRSNFGWDLDNFEQGSQATITIFSLAALGILILAIINFINLSTAQSSGRAREVALRKVSGARRVDIIIQFLGESVVISFIAFLLALAVIFYVLPLFNSIAGREISFVSLFKPEIIAALTGITFLTGILSGSYPSFFLSSFQPEKVLKGDILAGGQNQAVLRKILVVAQFSLTLFLITGSTIVNRQLKFFREKNLGMDTRNIIITQAYFQDYQNAKSIFLSNPDIISLTVSDPPNIDQRGFSNVTWEGRDPGTVIQFYPVIVDPDYLKTFGIDMAEGRFFSYDFPSDKTEAIVLNETAVKAMGISSPLGKKVVIDTKNYNIIGIIRDFHQTSLSKPIEPMILRYTDGNSLCLRINPDRIKETISFIDKTMKGYFPDPDRPVRIEILAERIEKFYSSEKKAESILAVFTAIALFTACLGLLGLASFIAERRTREIGLRKVFGAPVSGMIWLQGWSFTKWILLSGLIAGPLAFMAAGKWLSRYAYHISPGIGILLVVLIITLIIALSVVSYQSVRAAMTNPVDSLRQE